MNRMKIEFENCKVDGDVVEVVGKFSANLSDLESMVGKSRYDNDSLSQRILSAIANRIASEYLKTNKMEIIRTVDLKQITDAIQLKVVEGFSLNRS